MENKQIDSQLESKIKDIMAEKVPESGIVDQKMEDAYQKIREMKTPRKRRVPMALKFSAAAAILMLAMMYCIKNPAFAAQLPFIGGIFRGLEGQVSYPGDYSKHSITLSGASDDQTKGAGPNQAEGQAKEAKPNQAEGQAKETKPNQADGQAKEAKPNQADGQAEEAGQNQADGQTKEAEPNQADDKKDGAKPNQADGQAEDTEPYQAKSGGITVTLSEVSYDSNAVYLALLVQNEEGFAKDAQLQDQLDFGCQTKFYKADGSVEEFGDENGISMLGYKAEGEYVDSHTFQGIAQFTGVDLDISQYVACELTFCEFRQQLTTGKEKTVVVPDYGETTMMEFDWAHYPGTWKFRLDIDGFTANQQEIAVNDTNAQGFGIEKVVKTEYEMHAVPILPEGEEWYDYMITIWDADGKQLDYHGDDFTKMNFYGRDVSEVTIYLLRWEDFCESKGSNSYLQPSKAIYQTTVKFED